MVKSWVVFFCLILTQLSFAQTERRALIEEAFKGIPYFIYATIGEIDHDFYLTDEVSSFSSTENLMLKKLIKVLAQHGQTYKIVFCGPGPCLDANGEAVNFEIEKGQEPRTAVTSSAMDDNIYINLQKLNDPNLKMDFVDAIQILIHEISKKIPDLKQSAFDTLDAKLMASIRNGYATFKINSKRLIHVLTVERPVRFDATNLNQMKTFWINSQGFEVTTFDEADGYFRHIDEVRHHFASPDLMKALDREKQDPYHTLARNSIVGVEVDRFSDATTIVRIGSSQMQTLLNPDFMPSDLGPINVVREIVIKLKDNETPTITRREGYLPTGKNSGHLTSFEVVDSVLQGTGILPYRLGDMKDLVLSLLVRSHDEVLHIPLIITSRDPEGPVVFKFSRKFAEEREAAELIATDIVVNAGTMVPLNRIALETTSKISLKSSVRKKSPFTLQDAQVFHSNSWRSLRDKNTPAQIGDNQFRFIFASATLLQEMTIYLDHSRHVYDPKKVIAHNQFTNPNSRQTLEPTPFDTPITSEYETDVFRIAAPHMKQTLKDGILTVDVSLPIRNAMVLETKIQGGHGNTVKYGIDNNGIKVLNKIIAINEGLQKVSLNGNEYQAKLDGKAGADMSDKLRDEYNRAFIKFPDDHPANPFCKNKFK